MYRVSCNANACMHLNTALIKQSGVERHIPLLLGFAHLLHHRCLGVWPFAVRHLGSLLLLVQYALFQWCMHPLALHNTYICTALAGYVQSRQCPDAIEGLIPGRGRYNLLIIVLSSDVWSSCALLIRLLFLLRLRGRPFQYPDQADFALPFRNTLRWIMQYSNAVL